MVDAKPNIISLKLRKSVHQLSSQLMVLRVTLTLTAYLTVNLYDR